MKIPTKNSDPSGLFGVLGTVAVAVIAFLVSFGVPLTPDQQEAILGLVAVAGPAFTAWKIRRHAWAPDSVDAEIHTALVLEKDEQGNVTRTES